MSAGTHCSFVFSVYRGWSRDCLDGGLMLNQRRRHWLNISPASRVIAAWTALSGPRFLGVLSPPVIKMVSCRVGLEALDDPDTPSLTQAHPSCRVGLEALDDPDTPLLNNGSPGNNNPSLDHNYHGAHGPYLVDRLTVWVLDRGRHYYTQGSHSSFTRSFISVR